MIKNILKTTHLYLSLIMIAVLAMAGCSSNGNQEPTVTESAISPLPAKTLFSTPSPSLTPIPTTQPEVSPTPAKTTQTPSPTPTEERATLVDGFYYIKLNDEIKKRITGMSYPADDKNIAITYDDLRYLRLKYYDFDGKVHEDGELIVNKKLADEVLGIFYELYQKKYAFASIHLVDDYKEPGDDNLSMAANNTSAFNYRKVTGSNTLSRHSFGAAIDINPMMNPYIVGDRVAPLNGEAYADRSQHLPGMIDKDDLAYKLFTAKGWSWGGNNTDKDYQHFSKKI